MAKSGLISLEEAANLEHLWKDKPVKLTIGTHGRLFEDCEQCGHYDIIIDKIHIKVRPRDERVTYTLVFKCSWCPTPKEEIINFGSAETRVWVPSGVVHV
jgi:hypothetical protein